MSGPRERIGAYRLGKELGRGGMGVVFEAEGPGPSARHLALKLVSTSGLLDAECLERFLREGRLLARVDHPNVLRVHDLGRSAAGPYLVMDRLEGEPLDVMLRRGPLPARHVGELVAQLADGVAAIHAEGILHRDLKPENVIVRPDGTPVLLDFGLARELDGSSLTQTGTILGTPAYMAPEQARGDRPSELTPRVDVYGLGAIAFALLTGGPPHDGGSLVAILQQVLADEPVRWPETNAPEGLRAIVDRALAKAVSERFASAGELSAELRDWLDADARGEGRPSRRAPIVLSAAAAVLAVALVGVVASRGGEESGPPAPVTERARSAEPPPAPAQAEPWSPVVRPSTRVDGPPWFARLSEAARPPLPLPKGMRFGTEAGEYENTIDGSVMVWVPAGTARLGPPGELREKSFERGFFIGKTEVTWAQFARFLRVTGTRALEFSKRISREPRLPALFVACRSGARPYARWAQGRLPTGDEWEYAARGPKGWLFPWAPASTWAEVQRRAAVSGRPRPVGTFPGGASPFGCLDMIGNAFEYVDEVIKNNEGGDGLGARGGAFDQGPTWASVWRVASAHADHGLSHSGFRIVRDPD